MTLKKFLEIENEKKEIVKNMNKILEEKKKKQKQIMIDIIKKIGKIKGFIIRTNYKSNKGKRHLAIYGFRSIGNSKRANIYLGTIPDKNLIKEKIKKFIEQHSEFS